MKRKVILRGLYVLIFLTVIVSGCTKRESAVQDNNTPVSVKQFDVPPGADPSVTAELGGKGFTGEGWMTNADYDVVTNPNAVKGGSITVSLPEFPVTLRCYGKDQNCSFGVYNKTLFYETLLEYNFKTSLYYPLLATHWKISSDQKTFTFRINPDARWADGMPVTSDDFTETWKLLNDTSILNPYYNQLMSAYEKPVADSKYIFSIKSKDSSWRYFNIISTAIQVLPAHYLKKLTGSEYLDKYQFAYMPGTGPYAILEKDIVKGQALTVRRRSDYWGENLICNKGKNNFNAINMLFLENDLIQREKLKKGEIDILRVSRASAWKSEFNTDKTERGIIVKKKVFNIMPAGVNGICLNSKIKPLDDIRIRKAFIYAFDRKKLNEKLFDNSYILQNSYFPGGIYENPSNTQYGFNLDSSAMLLASAGWSERNSEGYLVKNGKVFEIEIIFLNGQDRYLTVYQEDLKKIGIKINLKEVDNAAWVKLGNDKKIMMTPVPWGELSIPNPENSYRSNTADEKSNANWPGISDKRIDELCDRYNYENDYNERIKIIRNIDSLLCDYCGYVLMWYAPFNRIIFHNKFGYPEGIFGRESGFESIVTLWYQDPLKTKEYNVALTDEKTKLQTGEIDVRYWLDRK